MYDTDGNMLQSIDDDELNTLLPALLDQISASPSDSISVLDLGCGTGRNTARLLTHPWPVDKSISVTGLDFSAGMLSLASSKLAPLVTSAPNLSLRLEQCNPFPSPPSLPFSPSDLGIAKQNLVLSTLVLEHIPLETFFTTLTTLLAPGGTALLTNMHADMGAVSQAGFVNAEGVKVRGESYVYTLAQTVQAAQDVGLEVLAARERRLGREDVERGVVGRRGEKWLSVKVWFGVVVRMR